MLETHAHADHLTGADEIRRRTGVPIGIGSRITEVQKVLEHEQFITRSIHEVYAAAEAEKDYATKTFLGWFVSEQVEEEAAAQLMVDRLAMIGESKGSLLYLDKEARKRE